MIAVKRVYEPAEKSDGYRVLVDRMWPRGLTKQDAALDLWLRDVAPSHELRKWYNHAPERWPVFCERYYAELADHADAVELLRAKAAEQLLTLLYSSREQALNNAEALKFYLSAPPGTVPVIGTGATPATPA